jgi:hypothetical protein
MQKKYAIIIILPAIILLQAVISVRTGAQDNKAAGKKAAVNTASGEDLSRDDRLPALYKRLVEAIQGAKLQPDQEGKIAVTMRSGNQFDMIERVFLVYSKRATVYMAQNRVSKIVFEYYQYNMTTQLREIKTFTTTTPDSEDIKALAVEYSTNIGDSEKYNLGDLQKKDSQKIIASQYYSYYTSLVYKIELYRDSLSQRESSKIDRTVQLGD